MIILWWKLKSLRKVITASLLIHSFRSNSASHFGQIVPRPVEWKWHSFKLAQGVSRKDHFVGIWDDAINDGFCQRVCTESSMPFHRIILWAENSWITTVSIFHDLEDVDDFLFIQIVDQEVINNQDIGLDESLICIRHTNYTTSSLKSEPPHRSLRAIPSLLESHR